jgi:diguanylate cyclase (GGDEF)-like protein/putative nucleotidyltransferase with HDIG domain
MNPAVIPLVAAVAYIPLIVILLTNRPWQSQQKFFFLFLTPAIFWSLVDVCARGPFFEDPGSKELLTKFVLFFAIWMMIQYHFFLRSFYRTQSTAPLLVYGVLAIYIILAFVVPGEEIASVKGSVIQYGWGIYLIAAVLGLAVGKDIYSLWRKRAVSADIAQRNQISYVFLGLAALGVFGIVSLAEASLTAKGGEYPLAHIGNFLNACVLTYAVVTHRLLDVRVIARRAIIYVAVYGSGVGILLLVVGLISDFGKTQISTNAVMAIIGLGIPAILFLVHAVRGFWQKKVEEAFIGERYHYRKLLSRFVSTMQNISNMEQFGKDFVYLLSQSIGARRACVLLPEAEEGGFSVRFTYPPVEDNPMKELRLRSDNPVVTWLKQKRIPLPDANVSIYPEFKSMWQEEREAIQSMAVQVFVPLVSMEELVGIIAIGERRDARPYSVEDLDLLNSIDSQVAASMKKEYFNEQLREQDKEITLLNRLTKIITSSVSIQAIFEGFAQELKEVVDIDWAIIALVDGNELHFLALSSTTGSPWQEGERISLQGTATEWVCQERKSLYEADLARYHRFWTEEHYSKLGISSIAYLPLTVTDHTIGTLILASRKSNAYSRRQIQLLEKVALQIATPVENAQLYARVEQKSRIDELTGLFNRRHFEERLKEEVARHSRYGDEFSIFMLDLDNFKTYNDVYGHPVGDIVLSEVGGIIKNSIRDADQAFRYGGDEFVVILPETDRVEACTVAERVRERIAAEMEKKSITVTCSIGLAGYPADGVIAGELVGGADTALYYAKWTGGNRTYFSSKVASESFDSGRTQGKRNSLSAVYALVSVVESRDPYIYGHSRKVNTYAVALAEALRLSPDDVSKVSTAALLHDIGKIGIPDEVLSQKDKLSRESWESIKAHPRLGANIVCNIPQLVYCANGILHHHEKWDGSGYPDGLKGEQIPLEARILAIADSFEAMTSARPYRPALSREETVEELRKGAGSQFDPNLVDVFIGVIKTAPPDKLRTGQGSSGK